MARTGVVTLIFITLVLAGCGGGPSLTPEAHPVQPNADFVLKGVKNLTQVARLIGADSINKTDRYAVAGADLGRCSTWTTRPTLSLATRSAIASRA